MSAPLSRSFTLRELLRSATAEREPALKHAQEHPPPDVLDNLRYLAMAALQPLRDGIGAPLLVTSGYRCPEVNARVGGSATSQHLRGEAADCELAPGYVTDDRTAAIRYQIQTDVTRLTGKPLRPDVEANFYLFAYVCLRLDGLDVDQVIHEYGAGYGRPAWVHVAASRGRDRRQILFIGEYTGRRYVAATVAEALAYGTAP